MSSSSSKPRKPTITNIGGIPIQFLFQPYGSQISFMSRVIATLDRAQRDGHFHALLESPTGTGKSFSLLCSVIAWQKNHKAKYEYGSGGGFISKVDPEAMDDPFGRGGGFVPEAEPSEQTKGKLFIDIQKTIKVDSEKDLANVGVIDVRGVDDTTFMKEASLEVIKNGSFTG
ncbi:fanconi anemia group J protein [Tanacetum coccineum]